LKGVQKGRDCYLDCTNTCFLSCVGRIGIEIDGIPPQDLAQGECESNGSCGKGAIEGGISAALQKEALSQDSVALDEKDLRVLAELGEGKEEEESKVVGNEGEFDLEKVFKVILGRG
jgi:hypothetical protein